MSARLIFLSIPGLRHEDLPQMPHLQRLMDGGTQSRIAHSFPCVTWPSQANMLTGKKPSEHGVIANGFYWRDKRQVEMWTAWNEVIEQPQIWDVLKTEQPGVQSAAWFPMLSKGCGADYICMPAPIHQPDGSEDLWCYTRPQSFYGRLLQQYGHFPLHHFWGPLANIQSSEWIATSALAAAEKFQPNFFYIYLPHLDYAAQKLGPDSPAAHQSVRELDELIGTFSNSLEQAQSTHLIWMVASEYVIQPVDHVLYPNRILRDGGWLSVKMQDGREHLDLESSRAWALVDHQFSHIFVNEPSAGEIQKIAKRFEDCDGVDQVLAGQDRGRFAMDHPRSGEIILISTPNSWQAYYWWEDDTLAPAFASTVDIHRKPGYDPIELHFDPNSKTIPLDATLAKGSHGAPARSANQKGLFGCSKRLEIADEIPDTSIFDLVLQQLR